MGVLQTDVICIPEVEVSETPVRSLIHRRLPLKRTWIVWPGYSVQTAFAVGNRSTDP